MDNILNNPSDKDGMLDIPFDEYGMPDVTLDINDISDTLSNESTNIASDKDRIPDIPFDENAIPVTPLNVIPVTPLNVIPVTPLNVIPVTPLNGIPVTPLNGTPGITSDKDGMLDIPFDDYGMPDVTMDKNDIPDTLSCESTDIALDENSIPVTPLNGTPGITSDKDGISDISFDERRHNKYWVKSFIEDCRVKLKWRDLSGDVIMDIGCGEEGTCGKAMLDQLPNVKLIIGIDNNPESVSNFVKRNESKYSKMSCHFADIRIMEKSVKGTIEAYKGKMDKVISTDVFGELVEKEKAFRNVYHLLKPGGEAAIMFLLTDLRHEWLKEMLKKPKWTSGYYVDDYRKKGADYYRKMVEKIGFQVIECEEYKKTLDYPSVEVCKDVLYEAYKMYFNVPSELLEEFKEDCLQVLLTLNPKDAKGRFCETFTELHILLTKPTVRV